MRRWLGWFAVAVVIGMQAGTVFKPLGTVGQTRVADWVDLLTPYAILGCAAMVLLRAGAGRGVWVLFGVGAVTFTLGHGLHLSANSISNSQARVTPDQFMVLGDPAGFVAVTSVTHLWDEVVSHWIWYLGLFLVMAALALALRHQSLPIGFLGWVLAVLVAVTLVNTYIEGGVPWLGIVLLGVGLAVGLAWRPDDVAGLLRVVAGLGLLLLVGWGVYWLLADGRAFPQFSELGWI